MQHIGVPDDIVGAGRAHQDQRNVLGNQGFEKGPPGLLRYRRVLVREIDDAHAVLAVETRELRGEADRIAVAPARPKTALAAVAAEMRTTARELHDDRT